MQKYLFLILDRYEASFSKTHQVRSPLDPKTVFRNCMLKFVGDNTAEHEEYYNDEVADEICIKNNLITFDDEDHSFLLIKLEN